MLIFMRPEMSKETFCLIFLAPLILCVMAVALLVWGFR